MKVETSSFTLRPKVFMRIIFYFWGTLVNDDAFIKMCLFHWLLVNSQQADYYTSTHLTHLKVKALHFYSAFLNNVEDGGHSWHLFQCHCQCHGDLPPCGFLRRSYLLAPILIGRWSWCHDPIPEVACATMQNGDGIFIPSVQAAQSGNVSAHREDVGEHVIFSHSEHGRPDRVETHCNQAQNPLVSNSNSDHQVTLGEEDFAPGHKGGKIPPVQGVSFLDLEGMEKLGRFHMEPLVAAHLHSDVLPHLPEAPHCRQKPTDSNQHWWKAPIKCFVGSFSTRALNVFLHAFGIPSRAAQGHGNEAWTSFVVGEITMW